MPFLGGFIFALALAAAAYWIAPRVASWRRAPARQAVARSTAGPAASPSGSAHLGQLPRVFPSPPFGTSEDGFEAAAKVYRARCAACHGTPAQVGALAGTWTPPALQLWRPLPGRSSASGAARTPGLIYTQITEGMPRSGMPAYAHLLSTTERWQLALLLASAGEPLPDPVLRLLDTPRITTH